MKNWILLLLLYAHLVSAQSRTMRLMTYNLLNYRNITAQCPAYANSAATKEASLDTILAAISPHIVVFNEVGADPRNGNFLLNQVFNVGGVSHWSRAGYSNNNSSTLTNVIVYRNDLFQLLGHDILSLDTTGTSLVRVIDVLRFHYLDPSAYQDSLNFTVIAAHFKAGAGQLNTSIRALAAAKIQHYLYDYGRDSNVFVMGDLNIYRSSEPAYQRFFRGKGMRFADPAKAKGDWSDKVAFAGLHTQSTQKWGLTSCFSSGGLDDRFDHILCTAAAISGEYGVTYSPGSYKAVGNDGLHLNSAINFGTNSSVTPEVLRSLFRTSDHLPVIADFVFDPSRLGAGNAVHRSAPNFPTAIRQPFALGTELQQYRLRLYAVYGQLVLEKPEGSELSLETIKPGLYMAFWSLEDRVAVKKLWVY